MTKQELITQIQKKKSFLCIGLDSDIDKIPKFLLKYKDPIFEFNRRIIDKTKHLCVSYKLNIAFYESMGSKGLDCLQKTIEYIPEDILSIIDAKRGDIGNTSKMYAKAYYETYNSDAVTLSPYMGADSITPFLEYKNKWAIILALTSNESSKDFQMMNDGNFLYEKVIKKSFEWGNDENIMFVVGATQPEKMKEIRKMAPNSFFLVPGIGAQGGDLDKVVENGRNKEIGLLLSSSRAIIYAGNDSEYDLNARKVAQSIQQKMEKYF